ncbi:MAG: universal stress protein [Methylophaga sp.]|jgi:nucleotide-binding universal stress UspA family protein|nr:universal stress protein [Methylophaga sp.]MEC9315120.1 universal stress protein [Pseudomonadota bacterium]MED5510310.1 universal stress protein [Pseudomonadota bacterium]
MKKILCATDGSHSAQKAVDYAIELAKLAEAELTFIHVVMPTGEDVSHTYFWNSNVLQAADEQIQMELHEAMEKAHQRDLEPVFCTTVPGHNIAKAIIDYAENNDHDHVVTGSVGRTGVAKVLLGSIAEQVISKAHCPVTVVR